MILTMDEQLISLIISVFAGLTIGLLFDLYRTVNYYTRPPKTFLFFTDLIFWVVTCIIVFIMLLNADYAELRIYTFAGMGLGVLVYFKLFSEYILRFYRLTIYIILKTVRMIFLLVRLPLKLIYNILWYPAELIKRFFSGVTRKVNSLFSSANKNTKKM